MPQFAAKNFRVAVGGEFLPALRGGVGHRRGLLAADQRTAEVVLDGIVVGGPRGGMGCVINRSEGLRGGLSAGFDGPAGVPYQVGELAIGLNRGFWAKDHASALVGRHHERKRRGWNTEMLCDEGR